MAKAAKQAPAAAPGRAGADGEGVRSAVWLSGLACGVLAAVAPGVVTIAAGLLIPGLVALKLDQAPGRPVARAVLTCGLAGCVQPVIAFWNSGQSFAAAVAIVTDFRSVGVAWGAAAAGWLVTQIAPLCVRALLEGAAVTRVARLRAARARLVELWGIDGGHDDAPGDG